MATERPDVPPELRELYDDTAQRAIADSASLEEVDDVALAAVLARHEAMVLRSAAADCRAAIEKGSYGRLANEVADMVERTLLKRAEIARGETSHGD